MNVFARSLAGAAMAGSLLLGGTVSAQDDQAVAEPPVVVVPAAPQANGASRASSARDWRSDIAADREAKGWGSERPRSQDQSRQNWLREYQRNDFRPSAQERWDRIRDPQDRSDRIGANRSSFTPQRRDPRADAEAQAQAYAALYWMMKAQAEQPAER